jgi:hypothetical protein
MTKKLLIIIPGSETRLIPLFRSISSKFYSYFGVNNDNSDWPFKLKDSIDEYIDTMIFEWQGGISNIFSLTPASKKLTNLIKKHQDYDEIILFGKSLGGVVAEKTIKKSGVRNISKLIYVATPHSSNKKRFPKNIKAINIYSNQDRCQELANKLLYFGFGKRTLSNAQNICIDNLNHSDFKINKPVNIDGEKINLFEYYSKLAGN